VCNICLQLNKQKKPGKDEDSCKRLFLQSHFYDLSCLAVPLNRRPYTRKRMKRFDVEGVYYERRAETEKTRSQIGSRALNLFGEPYNSHARQCYPSTNSSNYFRSNIWMNNHSLLRLACWSGDPELNSGMLVAFAFLSLGKSEHQSKMRKLACKLQVRTPLFAHPGDETGIRYSGEDPADRCSRIGRSNYARKSSSLI